MVKLFLRSCALVLVAAASLSAQQVEDRYTFRTLAGYPGVGAADGNGANAKFFFPENIAVASDGTLFVTDAFNHAVRRIATNGDVTTFAGALGENGFADGTGRNARFDRPWGPAIDRNGVMYIADIRNHVIRRITPQGDVTTIAGAAGQTGAADGPGSAARFNSPEGIAVDAFGNVYVGDAGNHTIRKISTSGVVSTVAGTAGQSGNSDGAGSSARFNAPSNLAVDSSGTIYVSDTNNHTIRKIVGDVVSTVAGQPGASGGVDGTGSAARFDSPGGLAIAANGDLYVADFNNTAIRKVTRDGVVTTFAGRIDVPGSADGAAANARFNYPNGIGIDSSGNVYVGDTNNHSVRKITSGGVVSTIAGTSSTGTANGAGASARFIQPFGIVVDRSGNSYVSDYYNHAIRKIAPDGTVSTFAGLIGTSGTADGSGGTARFRYPRQLAIDSAGNIYVADSNNHTIRTITANGDVTTLAGQAGTSGNADGTGTAARFNFPSGIAVDGAGTVYVADGSNNTIRKITPAGAVTTLAGQAGDRGSSDGNGTAARFDFPYGVAVASDNALYVSDANNCTIRRITAGGSVTTLAGQAGSCASQDGTGADARFWTPGGIAVDSAGTVFVADSTNRVLRRISQSGAVTTVAGKFVTVNVVDGLASQARFYSPQGVFVDSSGVLYVADRWGQTIRVGTPR